MSSRTDTGLDVWEGEAAVSWTGRKHVWLEAPCPLPVTLFWGKGSPPQLATVDPQYSPWDDSELSSAGTREAERKTKAHDSTVLTKAREGWGSSPMNPLAHHRGGGTQEGPFISRNSKCTLLTLPNPGTYTASQFRKRILETQLWSETAALWFWGWPFPAFPCNSSCI